MMLGECHADLLFHCVMPLLLLVSQYMLPCVSVPWTVQHKVRTFSSATDQQSKSHEQHSNVGFFC